MHPAQNSTPMPKVIYNQAKAGHGYDLLAIALDDIIPTCQTIEATSHRSRRTAEERYPQWRGTLAKVVRSAIAADRRWMGRKHPFPLHPVDVFRADIYILEYILHKIMPERAASEASGTPVCDNYPQWIHDLDGMVKDAVTKDRAYYYGTQRTDI